MAPPRQPGHRAKGRRMLMAAVVATCAAGGAAAPARADTLTGSGLALKSGTPTLSGTGYVGTYLANFRKPDATVALTGPSSIPLLSGTPVHVDLARHEFNFGTEVPGNTPSDVTSYLGTGGTSQQTNYQQRLNQNFNAIVPG